MSPQVPVLYAHKATYKHEDKNWSEESTLKATSSIHLKVMLRPQIPTNPAPDPLHNRIHRIGCWAFSGGSYFIVGPSRYWR